MNALGRILAAGTLVGLLGASPAEEMPARVGELQKKVDELVARNAVLEKKIGELMQENMMLRRMKSGENVPNGVPRGEGNVRHYVILIDGGMRERKSETIFGVDTTTSEADQVDSSR